MTIHWPTTKDNKEGRISAVKAVWFKGCSMSQLAAVLGTTRNAVSGLYGRNPELRTTHPLRDPPRPGVRNAPPNPKPKPIPLPRPAEYHGAGRPLMMLERRQCKWPVNDAERDQEHLFCGMPAEGPYCGHHASRSMRLREVR